MQSPKILYVLIARNGKILVDYAGTKGDFINETRDYVFPKLKDIGKLNKGRFVYTYNHCYYVYDKDSEGLTVMALLEEKYNKKLGFNFIEQIRKDFRKVYSRTDIANARENGLSQYQTSIRTYFENYNSNFTDKSKLVLDEVTDLKEQVSVNLQKLFERNRQMEDLESQVELLSDNSVKIMKKVSL